VGREDGAVAATGVDEGVIGALVVVFVVAAEGVVVAAEGVVVAAEGVNDGSARVAVGRTVGETDAGGSEGVGVAATGAAEVGGAVPGVMEGVAACNEQTGESGFDSVTVPETVGGTSLTASWTTWPCTTTAKPFWIVPVLLQSPHTPSSFPSATTSALVSSSRRYPRLYRPPPPAEGGRRISNGVLMHSGTSSRQWTECSIGPSNVTIDGLSNRNP
jgi:hypothetical protein